MNNKDSTYNIEELASMKPAPGIPYADWDACMARKPYTLRYAALSDKKQAEKIGENHIPELIISKWMANAKILDYISKKDLTPTDVQNQTGIDKALICHMKDYSRPFCVPATNWEALCYEMMCTTVHELVFGNKRSITLPRKYSVPAILMRRHLSTKEITDLMEMSKKQRDSYCETNPTGSSHHRPLPELMRERITSILEEYGYYEINAFGTADKGTETPNNVKAILTKFWDEQSSAYKPKYTFLCYAALYYRKQNMDYLVCEDPLRANDAYAESVDGKAIQLTGNLKEFWRNVLAVNEEQRNKLMEMLWAKLFAYIF